MRMLLTIMLGATLLPSSSASAQVGRPADSTGARGVFVPGRSLPDLTLPYLDGSARIDLANLRGRRVVLLQFASW